jgi:hypothetical protein
MPKEDQDETWTDECGTVWTRPTAWAYAQVCRANEAKRKELEALTRQPGDVGGHIRADLQRQVDHLRRLLAQAADELDTDDMDKPRGALLAAIRTTLNDGAGLFCPFCMAVGFDAPGLKRHLRRQRCAPYQALVDLP